MAKFVFFDWETSSQKDLPIYGTMQYVLDPSTLPLLLSWATDNDLIKLWVRDVSDELHPDVWAYIASRVWCYGAGKPKNTHGGKPFKGIPAEIIDRAADPEAYFVAWNAAFDRHVWQQVATPEMGFPEIGIEKTLDAMAQAQASNLPGSLDMAGRALGLGTKTMGGKAVMKRFADASRALPGAKEETNTPKEIADAIAAWELYLDYSEQDTELMRDVWNVTRPLDGQEWAEYWVSERINDRGLLADLDVCRGAVEYREEEAQHVEEECLRLTDGAIAKPTLTKQINDWVYERLPDDLAELMVRERDEEGYVTRVTGDKSVMTRLLEEVNISDTPPEDNVCELIELLQYGRSSSAIKFEKILNQSVDGRLGGSYVFNGAGQTGRYSSRGVQVHNLVRAYFENELDILDMVAAQVPIEEIRAIGPVSSVLSKLIRPTFVAPKKKLLVWGDWAAIEARVAPWLSDSRDADRLVLDPFRNGEDLYILNAEAIFNVPADVILERYLNGDKDASAMRQAGKVAVLALGFLGGVGALKAMARGYGMRLTDEEAKKIVDGWRDRNRWAKRYGVQLENAAFTAMRSPMTVVSAGKVKYQFVPDLMRGTLVAFLPDRRPIVYPMAKIEQQEKFDTMQDTIVYLNGMGRRSLWNGLQLENCLTGNTRVITGRGVVRLDSVQTTDVIWDGVDFVRHDGLVNKGVKPVISLWGVKMTADHKVLTIAGWKEAKDCKGFDRANVRVPYDVKAVRRECGPREESPVGSALCLRKRIDRAHRWLQEQSKTLADKLRVQNERIAGQVEADPRHVTTPGVLGLALDGGSLRLTNAPGMEELRGPRYHSLPSMARFVQDLLGGHGPDVQSGANNRPGAQRQGVFARELPVGYAQSSSAQYAGQSDDRHTKRTYVGSRSIRGQRYRNDDIVVPAEPRVANIDVVHAAGFQQQARVVYDLLNCGPRNRFVVLDGNDEPFVVHNCTQATAASILRGTLTKLDADEKDAEVIGHTHDEAINEVDEDKAWAFADRLEACMVEGFSWSEGLPLAAEVSVNWYYTKGKGMQRPN